ncbi:MAG: hypothetical protein BIFFINMI_02749 [Phycisphaerae bacterium]|nr:hypothetical protein [Phycisphaerae bacterium]
MPRTVVTALVVMILGSGLTWWWLNHRPQPPGAEQVDFGPGVGPGEMPPLPEFAAGDKCIACHQRESPAIVAQWARSRHAVSRYTCIACHEVPKGYPGSMEHEGFNIVAAVTPALCAKCHAGQVQQFNASRHSLRAWVAMTGIEDIQDNPALMKLYTAVTEIPRSPQGQPVLPQRNALYAIEGPQVTPVACVRCHSIGQPQADNSAGRCSTCHLRHEFSLEQVRKPETCNNCHIGPDHPQFEIYMESKHGVKYATEGHHWNWTARHPLGTLDFPAPTCQVCHMSGFGGQPRTHDVGDRLSLFLHEPITADRPNAADNRARMQNVCMQCHSKPFVLDEYRKGDDAVKWTNEKVTEATAILKDLQDRGLVTRTPFDERIEFTAFDLWHHWGRTTKFGAFMQGADYSQWHGAYELIKDMAELKEKAAELKARAGGEAPTTQPAASGGSGPPLVMRLEAGHGLAPIPAPPIDAAKGGGQ